MSLFVPSFVAEKTDIRQGSQARSRGICDIIFNFRWLGCRQTSNSEREPRPSLL